MRNFLFLYTSFSVCRSFGFFSFVHWILLLEVLRCFGVSCILLSFAESLLEVSGRCSGNVRSLRPNRPHDEAASYYSIPDNRAVDFEPLLRGFRKRGNIKKKPSAEAAKGLISCGGLTRTDDLWVMSPTSYQLLHSAMFRFLVSCGGLTRTDDLWVMSPTSYQLLHSAMFFS